MSAIWKSDAGRDAVLTRYRAILARVPVEQITVPTKAGETFVLATGANDAPVVMLHHGGAMNSIMWVGDMLAWSQHFRCYAVDMLGEPGLSAPVRPALGSEAYPSWLDDVWHALGVTRAAVAGTSLGGWLALDYATRRPERVAALALVCPAGVGRQRNFFLKMWPYLLLGEWGRTKMHEKILGKRPENPSPAARALGDFMTLIYANFRARRGRIPQIGDTALRRLRMPVTAYVGGADVLLDSADTKRRLEENVPHADVRFLPEAGHFIPHPTTEMLGFLRNGAVRRPVGMIGQDLPGRDES